MGPMAIINRAVLDEGVGVPRALQAVTLIDPLTYRFPLVLGPVDPSMHR